MNEFWDSGKRNVQGICVGSRNCSEGDPDFKVSDT